MILTTTETISGRTLATLGLVQGLWLAASLNHTLK